MSLKIIANLDVSGNMGGAGVNAVLSRANHTGTQLASTIADFNTAVLASTVIIDGGVSNTNFDDIIDGGVA